MSVRDGYGPTVSVGVTAHVAFVLVAVVGPDELSTARPAIERQVAATLAGVPLPIVPGDEPTGPVVTAPVQVDRMLIGMVVLPPPPRRGLLANVGELLTLPGTLALIVISAIAAVVIFAPARNRLRALEVAAQQLGGGRLTA
jgi:hypothetical protein